MTGGLVVAGRHPGSWGCPQEAPSSFASPMFGMSTRSLAFGLAGRQRTPTAPAGAWLSFSGAGARALPSLTPWCTRRARPGCPAPLRLLLCHRRSSGP